MSYFRLMKIIREHSRQLCACFYVKLHKTLLTDFAKFSDKWGTF